MHRKLNLRLLGLTLGAFLVLAVGVHFLHGYQLQQNAYRLLDHGDRALDAKEYEKALTYYGQYLSLIPDDPDAVQKSVQALDARAVTVGDRVRLILLMEQVLRAKPNEHELRFHLIDNLIQLDRISEAIDNLRKLQRTYPDKAKVLHRLGWCLEAKKEFVQAARAFEDAIKLKPTQIESYALLIDVLQDRLNQPDEAHKVMDALVQANADSYQAYLLRARYQRRRGDEKAADSDLESAYRLAPDRPEVILAVADAARAKGNWAEAARLLQDGLKRFPDQADLWKEIVRVKLHAGEREQALAFALDGLRNIPKSSELAILLIDLMIDQKQYPGAQKRIDELRKTGLKSTLPNYLQARIEIANQDWSEAINLLEEVRRELGPSSEWSSRVNVLLGVSYRHTGDREQELQAFRRAVEDEPDWATANFGLGGALLDAGRVEEASHTLEPLRNGKGAPPGYWVLLTRCRLAQQLRRPEPERRWGTVEEALVHAVQAEPKSVAVEIARAEFLAARLDFAGANAALEQMQREHPGDIAVWIARADLSARQDRFAEAEAILGAAAKDKELSNRPELRLAQCRLWGLRGDHADRAKLARLADHLPTAYTAVERARLKRTLADTWYHLGEVERAEALWREVARAERKDLRSRAMLLDAALEKRQTAAAQGWVDEMRAIEGESGWLWRYGAIAIQIQEAHGRRGQHEDARKKLKELDQLHKNWPRVPLLSAHVYELEGRYQQAIQEYTRAMELGEIPPRTLAHFVTLLVARREFGKAESALGKHEQSMPLTRELARLGAEIALGMRDPRYAKLAVTRAKQAVALPARDYRDLLWLARVYQATGDNAEAEKRLRESLEQAGHAPDTWIAWMEYLGHTNQRALAEQELARMTMELPASRYALTLARCYEALRQSDQAARAYQNALQAEPDDFNTLAYAADYYRCADQADQAQKLYRRLLEPARSAPVEYAVLARRHLAVLLAAPDADARKQALALLDANQKTRGHTLADERIRLYVQSLTSTKARQDALNKFQDSLRIELPTPDERVLLSRILESAGQLTEARAQMADALDENPTSVQYLARYVHLLVQTAELDDAERQLARLEVLAPGNEQLRDLRAALVRAKKEAAEKMP